MPRRARLKKPHNSRLVQEWEDLLKVEGLGVVRRQPNPYQSGSTGHDKITRDAKILYYQTLSAKTQAYDFPSERDAIIMRLAAEGKTFVQIVKELKVLDKSRCVQLVSRTVHAYEKLWKVRT